MSTTTVPAARDVHVIKPTRGWAGLHVQELWKYRELLFFFTWRNVLVRYKQTVLGFAWAILQPFFLMVVFSLFFGRIARVGSDGIPYPIFAYAALLPWVFFANSITQSSNSLVGNGNLLGKVYFPRLTIPMSTVLACLVDLFVASVVLIGMMAYYGIAPQPVAIVVLPALILLALTTALGVGLWLSALNVKYRDVQYVLPFLTQLWLFATPVVYPSSLVGEPWRTVLGLNPMAGVVEGFRWALLDAGRAPGPMIAVSTAVALALLGSGLVYFRRLERTFADVI